MFSDRRIRDALEAGRIGVWRWEVGTDHLEWSPNLEAIHDMPPGSFDGSFGAFADDIHPDDREGVMSVIAAALQNGGSYEVQYRLPPATNGQDGADGQDSGVDPDSDPRFDRWVEARGRVDGTPGAASVMTGICHDITARKRAEFELAERLEQQGAVAEIGRFALETDDLQAVFDRACRLLARTLGVAYGKVLELTPDESGFLLRSGIGWQDGLVGHAT
ncbi:MAG: PAS domain-containing protein, partial [Rhodospirillaceae bacterium]